MSGRTVIAVAAASLLVGAASRAQPPGALGLEDAARLALEQSPELAALEAEVAAAEARQRAAGRLVRANPELEVGAGPRLSGGGTRLDFEAGLAQPLEPFGQRGARIQASRAEVLAGRARLAAERAELSADVREVFVRCLAAERLEEVARQGLALAQKTAEATARRAELGDASRVEVNAARVDVGRARRELKAAQQGRAAAHGELRLLIGADGADPLRLEGRLEEEASLGLPESQEALLRRALERRPDLVSARAELERSRAEAGAARKEWLPRPTLGARYQREEGADAVIGTLSMALPLFDRNQGEREAAAAGEIAAERAVEAAERRVRQEVSLAFARLQAAREALQEFEGEALKAAEENLGLLEAAHGRGEVGLMDLLLIRREALEARRAQVEAQEEVRLAEVGLARAAGLAAEGR